MSVKKVFFFLIIISSTVFLNSQSVVNIDFNDCTTKDRGSIGSSVTIVGNAGCECGLTENSFEFDGIDDGLVFDNKVNPLFNKDFTIDFYFSIYNATDITDLMAFSNECLVDSFFAIQYIPSIKTLRVLLKENANNSLQLDAKVDLTQCWHHIAFVRKSYSYYIYLDGKIGAEGDAEKLYTFATGNSLTVSNSPCTVNNSANNHRFKGYIDDIRIYDHALNELELGRTEIMSDAILNQDTTIFLGDKISIEMGPTCADNFTWTGKQDMDNPESLTPQIQPKKSGKYFIYFVMKGKTCSDSISIYIQDKDKLDCKNLLLPNSFTPNGDFLNDNFGISNKFIIEKLTSFDIFDRWGTRVFTTNDINGQWNGYYRDNKLNPDKFVYKVSYFCKGEEYLKQGVLNLMR